jgi:hypothetical protein
MTKQLLIVASTALTVATLLAQPSAFRSAFQHPGWIAAPGSEPITVHMNRPEGQSGPVLAKPFSAAEVRHTVQTLANGTHVNHSDISLFYRDDRGRMRTESPTNVLIYDPVAGFTYHLDAKTKRYSKTPVPEKDSSTSIVVIGDSTWIRTKSERSTSPVETVRPVHGQLPFHSEPVAHSLTEDLPPQVIRGISVKGSRITMTIPVGTFGNDRDVKVINERWYSEDLQVLVNSSNSDPRFGVTTYELTNIVQAPPDPALFQVPADYTLRVEEQRHGGKP